MATIVTAPEEDLTVRTSADNCKLFLAGGITNCPDWQAKAIEELKGIDPLTIYNPRRDDFPIGDPNAAEAQIVWEYNHLKFADIIVFWFARGSLNPIVLYELGRWGTSSDRPMVVGVDADYERTQDVVIQTALSRPDVEVIDIGFREFVTAIKSELAEWKKSRREAG